MISTDFAPNEDWDDAWLSLKLLFQPWRWRDGKELNQAKKKVLKNMLHVTSYMLHVSFFLTGRSALYNLLKSLKLPKGSEIIVQAFTCEAVILPILANKLKPIYVDIETKTFSMNPIDLEKKMTDNTKVLILQHSFGMTPEHRETILSFVRKHKLVLIEDIAHGTQISNFKFQISNSYFLLSFGRSKAISSVYGGAIVTDNKSLINKLQKIEKNLPQPSYPFILKTLLYKPLTVIIKKTYDFYIGKLIHFILNKLNLLTPEITSQEKRGEYDPFLDKGYPNALAILLLHQFKKFERILEQRARICAIYKKISNLPLLRFPVLVDKRDEIVKRTARRNIFLGQWYDQVVAPKDLNLGKVEYRPGSCPVAEDACKKIINLPTNISLQEAKKITLVLSEAEGLNDVI